MEIRHTGLTGVLEIIPSRHGDERGYFCETYNANRLREHGIELSFCQDNCSYSRDRGVLRGLHYQKDPFAQDKLVRVVRGSVFDVAVDIRIGSPTYGKWIGIELSADKWNQLLVPRGFAHGFVTLEPDTEFLYKVTSHYSPEHDRSIRFDDPAIGIDWPFPADKLMLSTKDRNAPPLSGADNDFVYEG